MDQENHCNNQKHFHDCVEAFHQQKNALSSCAVSNLKWKVSLFIKEMWVWLISLCLHRKWAQISTKKLLIHIIIKIENKLIWLADELLLVKAYVWNGLCQLLGWSNFTGSASFVSMQDERHYVHRLRCLRLVFLKKFIRVERSLDMSPQSFGMSRCDMRCRSRKHSTLHVVWPMISF